MNRIMLVIFLISFMLLAGNVISCGDTSLKKSDQAFPGQSVTARQAYDRWRSDPENVKILDVRTPEEYVLIGHPPMAVNIPYMFLKDKWYLIGDKPAMVVNTDFVVQVKDRFKPSDSIYVMCRVGGRSARAADLLAGAGFTRVYQISDGFEGETVKDNNSYFKGRRMKNGWKNAGAPCTCQLDPALVYRPIDQ